LSRSDNRPNFKGHLDLAPSIDFQAELGHQRLPELDRIGQHLAKLSGSDSGVASNPISIMSRWYSGVDKSARVVLAILSTMGFGVPAGASRP
jgi:hypothetical protein